MSERLRTWQYLCDICTHCSEVHIEHIGTGDYECAKYGLLDLRKAIDFMRIWISEDAHLGESAISYELEKAEGLRKLDAIESAIAATLGDAFTREECEASFVHGYSLGTLPVGSDPQWDENRQTVDEHMAELGWVRERTCHNASHRLDESRFHCSECGFGCWVKNVATGRDELPNHCPNCGAKVVSE